MAGSLKYLTPESLAELQATVDDVRNLMRNVPRSSDQQGAIPSPDLFAARIPSTGIKARASSFVFSALTQVYQLVEVGTGSAEELLPVSGFLETVHNLSSSDIPGNSWVLVERDRWGSWWALPSASSASFSHVGCDLATLQSADCASVTDGEQTVLCTWDGSKWTSSATFCYPSLDTHLACGVVAFWFSGGVLHLSIDGKELLGCGDGCFTGGPLTGHAYNHPYVPPSPPTIPPVLPPPEFHRTLTPGTGSHSSDGTGGVGTGTSPSTYVSCQGETFTVCVSCAACSGGDTVDVPCSTKSMPTVLCFSPSGLTGPAAQWNGKSLAMTYSAAGNAYIPCGTPCNSWFWVNPCVGSGGTEVGNCTVCDLIGVAFDCNSDGVWAIRLYFLNSLAGITNPFQTCVVGPIGQGTAGLTVTSLSPFSAHGTISFSCVGQNTTCTQAGFTYSLSPAPCGPAYGTGSGTGTHGSDTTCCGGMAALGAAHPNLHITLHDLTGCLAPFNLQTYLLTYDSGAVQYIYNNLGAADNQIKSLNLTSSTSGGVCTFHLTGLLGDVTCSFYGSSYKVVCGSSPIIILSPLVFSDGSGLCSVCTGSGGGQATVTV